MGDTPVDARWGQPGPAAGKLNPHALDVLLRRLDALPARPAALAKLLSELGGLEGPARSPLSDRVVELFACDPAAAADLLRQANRDARQCIENLRQAAESLPADDLFAILAAASPTVPAAEGFDLAAFRRHSLAVAVAARILSERMPGGDPERAYLCGLLHDVGKLAMLALLPKSFLRAVEAARDGKSSLATREREILGVDHALVGKRLAELWRLGPAVTQVAWMHHQPLEAIPSSLEHGRLAAVVGLADALVRQHRLGISGNEVQPAACDESARKLGWDGGPLDELIGAITEGVQGALDRLGEATPENLDAADWLREAHGALLQTNKRLRERTERLARQAECYKRFRAFAAGLSADPSLSQALMSLAEIARGDEPAGEPVWSYSVQAEAGQIVALRRGPGESCLWRTLPLPEDQPGHEPPQDLPSALAELDELSRSPEAGEAAHVPLICAGEWIGGLLIPASRAADLRAVEDLADAMAMAMAVVRGRARAVALGEQLAQAAQALSAAHEADAETRTLAAAGEMAAGAAHEMNTPLAVISGRAQLMGRKAQTEDERATWRLIAEQAQRVSDTITALMESAAPPPPKPGPVAPAELLKEAAEMFSRSDHPQAAHARVDISVGDGVPPVWADREQIRSAVVELIANAATAAGAGAAVRLSAARDAAQGAVLLTVSDNGPGMDEETRRRAFTPFFSRQAAGRRKGLGLTRAKRQVENNGGQIWIRRSGPEGTSMCVQLPAVSAE